MADSHRTFDLDDDGDLDLTLPSDQEDRLIFYQNDGHKVFREQSRLAVKHAPLSLAFADLDLDGDDDILVASGGGPEWVQGLIRRGPLQYDSLLSLQVSSDLLRLDSADFNGDFWPDAAILQDPAGISILLNERGSLLAPEEAYFAGIDPSDLVIADLDADGDLDLAAASLRSSEIHIYANQGGQFAEAARIAPRAGPIYLLGADLDGDGLIDLAAVNLPVGSISRIWNSSTPPASSDCNGNVFPDACDLEEGLSTDCNANSIPDEFDLRAQLAEDRDGNGVLDRCERPFFHRGDANTDGEVDGSDAIFLLRFLFLDFFPLSCLESGDAENDNRIELPDSLTILHFVFKGSALIPAPGPPPAPCGPDDDDLGLPGDLGCKTYSHCQ